MLGFVSNLARAFEYAGDAAQLKAIVRSLGDNIDKLLSLVTTSRIVVLKYVRYSFAGSSLDITSPFASQYPALGRALKPNDKKELDRLQEELDKMKSDVSDGIGLHVARAVDEIGANVEDIGANLEDMGKFEEARRNLEDLLASESIHVPAVLHFF